MKTLKFIATFCGAAAFWYLLHYAFAYLWDRSLFGPLVVGTLCAVWAVVEGE